MVLDVLPKIMNTFIVLIADEGISASHKSFSGLIRAHRLFLALAAEFPSIKQVALSRLRRFAYNENARTKSECPSLGNLLPLMMIVDQKDFGWPHIRASYLSESLARNVLWVCKEHPQLERTHTANGQVETAEDGAKRVDLTREAMTVSLRPTMFHVYFLHASCRGSAKDRSYQCDFILRQPSEDHKEENKDGGVQEIGGEEDGENQQSVDEEEATVPQKTNSVGTGDVDLLSLPNFRHHISRILAVECWQEFFKYIRAPCPPSKAVMAQMLRHAVRQSRRLGYHKAGMDFSRVQASGTSTILAKGQQYSASPDLRLLIFSDSWTFGGHDTVYLDASCLVYKGKKRVATVDYSTTRFGGDAIRHSGDVMSANGGTHTIHLDLYALDPGITSLFFVLSSWDSAKMSDVSTAAVSFTNADADDDAPPLCLYDLDAHDKIAHLTSVVMCKLYRARVGGWHVLSIGDAHRGAADNYGPIYSAVEKLL